MAHDEHQERALHYLYGLLSEAEEQALREQASRDPALARCLAEEERLQRLLPLGGGAEPPAPALERSRQALRAALREAAPSAPGLRDWLEGLVPRIAWPVGAVAAVLCGVLLGRATTPEPSGPSPAAGSIVDVRVQAVDEATGTVRLAVSRLHTAAIEGSLGEPAIQAALAAALRDGQEPAPRLDAVHLLSRQTGSAETRQVLAHALLHDDNPGVRVAAAEALAALAGDALERDAPARRALQGALLHDDNPGVRVAAVEALRDLRDDDTRRVLERARRDFNQYIRAEAARALAGWDRAERL